MRCIVLVKPQQKLKRGSLKSEVHHCCDTLSVKSGSQMFTSYKEPVFKQKKLEMWTSCILSFSSLSSNDLAQDPVLLFHTEFANSLHLLKDECSTK